MIGICFGIIYGVNVWKLSSKSKVLPWVCSIVILVVNEALSWVVKTLSIKEKHETYTAYNLSVAFKMTFARFINSAVVPCIVNISSDKWFNEGGLVSDIFSIMISLSF